METDRFIECLRSDLAAMASAARSTGLATDVPTCPGWDVRDLIIHTGVIHRHKAVTLLGDYREKPAPLPGAPDDAMLDADLVDWFDEGAAQLLDAFSAADLSESTWTWCRHDHTKVWWVRRMAHETVIHRIDAETAVGIVPAIGAWIARDGVDEILDEFMIGGPSWGAVTPSDRTVRLRSGDRVWDLRTAVFSGTSPFSGETYEALDTLIYDSADPPMATVTADPEALDLWLWGRGDLPDGAVDGDASVVSHLRAVAVESTQ